MDKLRHANQLLHWTEQGKLTGAQLVQASEQIALQPAITDWLSLAQRILLTGAVILAASAIIFFFAHNWPQLHYFSKLALATSMVVFSGAAAYFTASDSNAQIAAILCCNLMTGALLALIGQTYQTGADIWQLFAGWAALITPLVLLAKSRLNYLLWFCLLELALLRFLELSPPLWLLDQANTLTALVVVNLLLWAVAFFALPIMGVVQNTRLHWLGVIAVVIPAMLGAISGPWQQKYQLNLLLFALLLLPAIVYFYRWKKDVLVLALWLFAAIAVATSVLARALKHTDELISFNLLALFVIGCTAGVASWLRRQLVHKEA